MKGVQPPGTSLVSTAGISAAGSPLTTASSSAAKSPGSPAAILSAAVQCSMARPSGRPSRSHRKYAASRNALLGVVWLHRALPWITQQRSRGARVRDSCSARTSPRDEVWFRVQIQERSLVILYSPRLNPAELRKRAARHRAMGRLIGDERASLALCAVAARDEKDAAAAERQAKPRTASSADR